MKFGICSEIFNDWKDPARTIEYVKRVGYDGLEIAPFSLAPDVSQITPAARADIVKRAAAAQLEIIGLHWVFVGPEGVYLTHPDAAVRQRTAQYLISLVHCCADLGGKLIIFGSPKQRSLMPGVTMDQARNYAREVFEQALRSCEANDVTICMEPLTHLETDFCTTAAETVQLIEAVNHPNFQLILDTKAMTFEWESRAELIKRYAKHLRHYHANDENLQGPGFGNVDFTHIFKALREIKFDGFVSVEVFNFDPGPEAIAEKSLAYMKQFVS